MMIKLVKITKTLLAAPGALLLLLAFCGEALAKSKFKAAHETFAGKAEHGPEHLGTGLIIAACIFTLIAIGIAVHMMRVRAHQRRKMADKERTRTRGENRPL